MYRGGPSPAAAPSFLYSLALPGFARSYLPFSVEIASTTEPDILAICDLRHVPLRGRDQHRLAAWSAQTVRLVISRLPGRTLAALRRTKHARLTRRALDAVRRSHRPGRRAAFSCSATATRSRAASGVRPCGANYARRAACARRASFASPAVVGVGTSLDDAARPRRAVRAGSRPYGSVVGHVRVLRA